MAINQNPDPGVGGNGSDKSSGGGLSTNGIIVIIVVFTAFVLGAWLAVH